MPQRCLSRSRTADTQSRFGSHAEAQGWVSRGQHQFLTKMGAGPVHLHWTSRGEFYCESDLTRAISNALTQLAADNFLFVDPAAGATI
jgi:hypothetical protein